MEPCSGGTKKPPPGRHTRTALSEKHWRGGKHLGDWWGVRKGVLICAVLGARHCRRSVNCGRERRPVSSCLWGWACLHSSVSGTESLDGQEGDPPTVLWGLLDGWSWFAWNDSKRGELCRLRNSTESQGQCSSWEHHGWAVMDVCWFRQHSIPEAPTHLECYTAENVCVDTIV